jgi:hypothetical protein
MAKAVKATQSHYKTPIKKHTSIGTYGVPKNKHKRRSYKPYRGQG